MILHKICFITCEQDPLLYQETLLYIQALHVPQGYEIETISVAEAEGTSKAYQYAMEHSDAKYKIYVRSNVFLVNRNLLMELIELFNIHPQLGLVGVAGASYLPLSLAWEDANERVGTYYGRTQNQSMEEIFLGEVEQPFQLVPVVSDMFLATQYDVKWDTDFSGEHFLGAIHAVQFQKEGYQVGVARQSLPWCLVDQDEAARLDSEQETTEREKFLQAYSHMVFPKVSILIPTYNRPQMLEYALYSVVNQTYRHLEIIVCDDSTNDETERMIQPYLEADSRIRYVKNERNLGQYDNDLKLLSLATGEYVNFLMDDDLFHYRKIQFMMKYMLDDREEAISLVTSHRGLIDADGLPIEEEAFNRRVFQKDTRVSGIDLGNIVLRYNWNCIGEPTTPLFRKKALTVPFGTFAGRKYGCNVDTATWLSLLKNSDAVYISATLSYFRIHGEQQLQSSKMKLLGAADFAHELLASPAFGYLADTGEYRKALEYCITYAGNVLVEEEGNNEFPNLVKEVQEFLETLKQTHHAVTPTVSILIPTYNRPALFEQALQSAINQSYPNVEIIVCDDSTNDETEELIQTYLQIYPQLRYIRNENNLGQFENDLKLMRLASGEYINFLMDDDLLHPEKISKMMNYFLQDPEITIATSHRQIINESGQKYRDIYANQPLFDDDAIVNGIEVGEHILQEVTNRIGEPTTVLFKKSALKEDFGVFCGRKYGCNVDLASWVNLLAEGKLAYLAETLSSFRIHAEQQQHSAKYTLLGWSDFAHQLIYAPTKGFFKGKDLAYFRALRNCHGFIAKIIQSVDETSQKSSEFQNMLELEAELADRMEEVKRRLPLVSVLIPAYNRPYYLELALISVLVSIQ